MDHTLTPRQIEALRALASGPGGIRKGAYPSAMPGLFALGLVREGVAKTEGKRPIWLLTDKGRKVAREIGSGEPRE